MVSSYHPNGGKVAPVTKSESKTKTHTALQAQSGSSVNTGTASKIGGSKASGTTSKATSQAVNHQPGNGPGGVADKRGARPGLAMGGNGVGDVRKRNPMGNAPKSSFKSRHVPGGTKRSSAPGVS